MIQIKLFTKQTHRTQTVHLKIVKMIDFYVVNILPVKKVYIVFLIIIFQGNLLICLETNENLISVKYSRGTKTLNL